MEIKAYFLKINANISHVHSLNIQNIHWIYGMQAYNSLVERPPISASDPLFWGEGCEGGREITILMELKYMYWVWIKRIRVFIWIFKIILKLIQQVKFKNDCFRRRKKCRKQAITFYLQIEFASAWESPSYYLWGYFYRIVPCSSGILTLRGCRLPSDRGIWP